MKFYVFILFFLYFPAECFSAYTGPRPNLEKKITADEIDSQVNLQECFLIGAILQSLGNNKYQFCDTDDEGYIRSSCTTLTIYEHIFPPNDINERSVVKISGFIAKADDIMSINNFHPESIKVLVPESKHLRFHRLE